MEKRKRTKNFAVHLPHHLAYSNIPAPKPTNDTTNIRTTHTVGIIRPVAPPTHPFEACIRAARNTGFAEGRASRALEVRELMVKLQSFERHIAQLAGRLRGSEKLEAEKMDSEGHLRHHQETTDSSSDALTPVNRTVTAAAHVFREFIPGALFHRPISRSTAALPTNSVILSHPNSPPKSSNPWGSLALHHNPSTKSFIPHIYLQDTGTSIYVCADCKRIVTRLIDPKLGLLTFWFGWGDEGVAMWVGGTCVRGSVGFEGGVVRAVSGVLLRPQ
jgi:hypothetical protein